MEKYKMVLKKRVIILIVLIIFATGLGIFGITNMFQVESKDTFSNGALAGFQTGLLFAIIVLSIGVIFRYIMAINDSTKLKKLYNIENDERRKAIKEKSGANVIIFSSTIIIFAGIISGYFNEIVFFSLIGCALFLLTVSVFLKLYYSKKY